MLPLLPFAAGLITGALAIKIWRNDKAKNTLGTAKDKIRQATVNGLSRLESSSAAMREKLSTVEEPSVQADPAPDTPTTEVPATDETSTRSTPVTPDKEGPWRAHEAPLSPIGQPRPSD